jgi:hypothetical protein
MRSNSRDELNEKVAFLDARLTLLERKLERLSAARPDPRPAMVSTGASVSCSEPSLLVVQSYAPERDGRGAEFRWIGNDGPVQMAIPVMPVRSLTCCLRLVPHPRVDFNGIRIRANDIERPALVSREDEEVLDLYFNMDADATPYINIMLEGVRSVRPSEIGENDDSRFLAARFYGAEITYTSR